MWRGEIIACHTFLPFSHLLPSYAIIALPTFSSVRCCLHDCLAFALHSLRVSLVHFYIMVNLPSGNCAWIIKLCYLHSNEMPSLWVPYNDGILFEFARAIETSKNTWPFSCTEMLYTRGEVISSISWTGPPRNAATTRAHWILNYGRHFHSNDFFCPSLIHLLVPSISGSLYYCHF